jgi:hypothetical protein
MGKTDTHLEGSYLTGLIFVRPVTHDHSLSYISASNTSNLIVVLVLE